MKRNTMIRIFCAVFAAALLMTCLAACGKAEPAPSPTPAPVPGEGTWEGEYRKFVGDSDEDKVTDESFALVLKGDGTGVFKRDDSEYRVTAWSLEGESFALTETFIGITNEYTGVMKDGRLNLFNGDPEDIWTCEYVFHLEK